MSELARVLEDRRGEVLVAALDGEVDASNAAEVGERLRRALGNASTALVLDLSPTSYLDSAGISLVFRLAEELGARQQRLVVVVPPGRRSRARCRSPASAARSRSTPTSTPRSPASRSYAWAAGVPSAPGACSSPPSPAGT